MQGIRILIVEDEVIIAESLRVMLEGLGYLVPAVYESGTELLQNYNEGYADMILMDINLANNTNGVETSKILARFSNIPIIYMTQNPEDSVRKKAIAETNATYYLHKPFSVSDLSSAIELTLKHLKQIGADKSETDKSEYLLNDFIFFKDNSTYRKVKLNDIIMIKADGSYSHVHCPDKVFVFSENLSFFDDKLLFAKDLLRVHRSYIINVNHIDKIQYNRIWVNGAEVPVGKTYRPDLLKKFRLI